MSTSLRPWYILTPSNWASHSARRKSSDSKLDASSQRELPIERRLSSTRTLPDPSFARSIHKRAAHRTSTASKTYVALCGALQALSLQREQLRAARQQVADLGAEVGRLGAALSHAEAKLEAARLEAAALARRTPGSARQIGSKVVSDSQRTETLALLLDLLNWTLGEGPPFSRAAFWQSALPRGVKMLQACGEDFELVCVSAAAWRPKVEVGEGGSPPSILPHPLECMVRRARDRCNLRLMRDAAVSRSCADKRRLATKGDEGEVPPQPPFSPGLLEGGELPAIPLSIIELGGESKGSPARKGVEGGGRIALVAPEGEGICCVNDSRIPLLLRRSDALGEDAVVTIEPEMTCELTCAPNSDGTIRFAVLRQGEWLEAVVRREPCDGISQYGTSIHPDPSPEGRGGGAHAQIKDDCSLCSPSRGLFSTSECSESLWEGRGGLIASPADSRGGEVLLMGSPPPAMPPPSDEALLAARAAFEMAQGEAAALGERLDRVAHAASREETEAVMEGLGSHVESLQGVVDSMGSLYEGWALTANSTLSALRRLPCDSDARVRLIAELSASIGEADYQVVQVAVEAAGAEQMVQAARLVSQGEEERSRGLRKLRAPTYSAMVELLLAAAEEQWEHSSPNPSPSPPPPKRHALSEAARRLVRWRDSVRLLARLSAEETAETDAACLQKEEPAQPSLPPQPSPPLRTPEKKLSFTLRQLQALPCDVDSSKVSQELSAMDASIAQHAHQLQQERKTLEARRLSRMMKRAASSPAVGLHADGREGEGGREVTLLDLPPEKGSALKEVRASNVNARGAERGGGACREVCENSQLRVTAFRLTFANQDESGHGDAEAANATPPQRTSGLSPD